MKVCSMLVAAAISCAAVAQPTNAFPPSSTMATAQELDEHLAGKTFNAVYADGTRVQTKFGTDRGLFASAPGFTDSGKWRVEEGKVCGSLRKTGDFCNEARFDAGTLYLRRMNGEVIRYVPN
jgi:hypothetical protein